jgi:hypothetical protein
LKKVKWQEVINILIILIQLYKRQLSQDQPVNTDWFDEVTRTYTQNNISVSGSTENKVFFSVGNYEEKAVLNGLDYSRTTFRNNNEYKISKKLTLNQNFSFGITNQIKAFKCFYECLQAITYYSCSFSNGQYVICWKRWFCRDNRILF